MTRTHALAVVFLLGCDGGAVPHGPAAPDCDAPGVMCTVAGTGLRGYNGRDGEATALWLNLPSDVAWDHDGRLVVVDYNNNRLLRVEADGAATTIAGVGIHGYAVEGPALDSPFENPIALRVGADGTMFVVEQHGARVLAIDPSGMLSVLAGRAGAIGWSGDGGPATEARISESMGLALDDDGVLSLADSQNHCIRSIDTATGVIDAVAGSGSPELADGLADHASFSNPQHLAWHEGAVYVADAFNHAIRRVDVASGEVTTVAGGLGPGFSGDGGRAVDASLWAPQGIDVGPDGTLYVADTGNHVVRRIAADGTISTIVGVGGVPAGFPEQDPDFPELVADGDGGPAEDALLNGPMNVRVAPDGALVVLDTLNSVVRRVR